MVNLNKKLRKFSAKERAEIENLVERILKKEFVGLNLKKLKGLKNLFRIRKGRIRIIFELKSGQEPNIISIDRRSEDTYKI